VVGEQTSEGCSSQVSGISYIYAPSVPLTLSNSHLCRMASAAFRSRIVRDFQTQLFKTCGMRSVVLVAYEDKDGHVRAAMYFVRCYVWIAGLLTYVVGMIGTRSWMTEHHLPTSVRIGKMLLSGMNGWIMPGSPSDMVRNIFPTTYQ
jgi:hypothetical protein